jgi:PAS domain S-box-containing protein
MTDPRGLYGDHRYISAGDQRRSGQAEQSPADKLQQMPAVVVLEWMRVPVLAIDKHGTILFANAAFAAMLGHAQDTIEQLTFHQIFLNPVDGPAATEMRAYTDELVELTHRDGFTVLARMSKSAMKRYDDEVALVVFEDLTEQLWTDGRLPRACPNVVKYMTNA